MQAKILFGFLLLNLVFTAACNRLDTALPSAPAYDASFWAIWGDGQAELAGYDLMIPRYGELRRGVAVTIVVTEPFSGTLRVKADPGKHPPSDVYPAMKLNLVKDYQTGIYDYHEMTSSFVALQAVDGRPAGSPVKVSFSRQEWCGNTYHQLLFDKKSVRVTRHSYFDGDADQQTAAEYPQHGVSEDSLYLWARGMAGPVLGPGESRTVPLWPALSSAKGAHGTWMQATLSRSSQPQQIGVPAGAFAVEVWSARIGDAEKRSFYVEKASPHRVIKWESSSGEHAELLKADRMKYWQMNGKGQETALRKLALSPRPPRTT